MIVYNNLFPPHQKILGRTFSGYYLQVSYYRENHLTSLEPNLTKLVKSIHTP